MCSFDPSKFQAKLPQLRENSLLFLILFPIYKGVLGFLKEIAPFRSGILPSFLLGSDPWGYPGSDINPQKKRNAAFFCRNQLHVKKTKDTTPHCHQPASGKTPGTPRVFSRCCGRQAEPQTFKSMVVRVIKSKKELQNQNGKFS